MKDEYLKAYQQRIEEIKALDVSPEEKRKLAADAKNEILDQYKTSYIKGKEEAAKQVVEPNQEKEVVVQTEAKIEQSKVDNHSEQETAQGDQDDIGNIINKLEEREETGQVGIDLDTPTEFMDPDALFSTMNLDDLFSSLGIEDDGEEVEVDEDSELSSIDDIFMDSDALFAGLLDDFDEVEDEVDSSDILNEFDLGEDTAELEPTGALSADAIDIFNMINEEDNQPDNPTTQEHQPGSSIETNVEEIEELIEGVIVDDEDEVTELSTEAVDTNSEELEELEKERERAQKLGIIELALLVVLIMLVIIVVYLIIGV